MYTFYTLFFIGFLVTILITYFEEYDKLQAALSGIFFSAFFAFAGTMFCSIISNECLYDDKHWAWEDESTVSLYSIRDKNGVNGSFRGSIFLIQGKISGSTYYNYYTKDPRDGALIPSDLNIGDKEIVRIYEDNSSPRIKTLKYVFQDRGQWQLKWFWNIGLYETVQFRQYNIYVPAGTVRNEMTM